MTKPRRFRPRNNRPRCTETGLVRYRDTKDAKLAIRTMQMVRASALINGVPPISVPVRSFKCGCGGTHLTRQTLADRAAIEVAA